RDERAKLLRPGADPGPEAIGHRGCGDRCDPRQPPHRPLESLEPVQGSRGERFLRFREEQDAVLLRKDRVERARGPDRGVRLDDHAVDRVVVRDLGREPRGGRKEEGVDDEDDRTRPDDRAKEGRGARLPRVAQAGGRIPRPCENRIVKALLASLALLLAAARPATAAGPLTFVACAPGFPGSTSEAQPRMDAFAHAVGEAVKAVEGSIRAEYYETEDGGTERLAQADAAFLLAPLPFFLKYEERLHLAPRAQAVMQGRSDSEAWSLVAGKGRLKSPDTLASWDLVSTAAYAPRFVRGSALGEWGRVPPKTRISP